MTIWVREIELSRDAISLDLLKAVYRNSDIPLPVRMRAAIAALPHEAPRLQVTAQVSESDFATLLDQRIKRYQEMKLIEAKAPAVEVKAPLPRIPDRRYRRI